MDSKLRRLNELNTKCAFSGGPLTSGLLSPLTGPPGPLSNRVCRLFTLAGFPLPLLTSRLLNINGDQEDWSLVSGEHFVMAQVLFGFSIRDVSTFTLVRDDVKGLRIASDDEDDDDPVSPLVDCQDANVAGRALLNTILQVCRHPHQKRAGSLFRQACLSSKELQNLSPEAANRRADAVLASVCRSDVNFSADAIPTIASLSLKSSHLRQMKTRRQTEDRNAITKAKRFLQQSTTAYLANEQTPPATATWDNLYQNLEALKAKTFFRRSRRHRPKYQFESQFLHLDIRPLHHHQTVTNGVLLSGERKHQRQPIHNDLCGLTTQQRLCLTGRSPWIVRGYPNEFLHGMTTDRFLLYPTPHDLSQSELLSFMMFHTIRKVETFQQRRQARLKASTKTKNKQTQPSTKRKRLDETEQDVVAFRVLPPSRPSDISDAYLHRFLVMPKTQQSCFQDTRLQFQPCQTTNITNFLRAVSTGALTNPSHQRCLREESQADPTLVAADFVASVNLLGTLSRDVATALSLAASGRELAIQERTAYLQPLFKSKPDAWSRLNGDHPVQEEDGTPPPRGMGVCANTMAVYAASNHLRLLCPAPNDSETSILWPQGCCLSLEQKRPSTGSPFLTRAESGDRLQQIVPPPPTQQERTTRKKTKRARTSPLLRTVYAEGRRSHRFVALQAFLHHDTDTAIVHFLSGSSKPGYSVVIMTALRVYDEDGLLPAATNTTTTTTSTGTTKTGAMTSKGGGGGGGSTLAKDRHKGGYTWRRNDAFHLRGLEQEPRFLMKITHVIWAVSLVFYLKSIHAKKVIVSEERQAQIENLLAFLMDDITAPERPGCSSSTKRVFEEALSLFEESTRQAIEDGDPLEALARPDPHTLSILEFIPLRLKKGQVLIAHNSLIRAYTQPQSSTDLGIVLESIVTTGMERPTVIEEIAQQNAINLKRKSRPLGDHRGPGDHERIFFADKATRDHLVTLDQIPLRHWQAASLMTPVTQDIVMNASAALPIPGREVESLTPGLWFEAQKTVNDLYQYFQHDHHDDDDQEGPSPFAIMRKMTYV